MQRQFELVLDELAQAASRRTVERAAYTDYLASEVLQQYFGELRRELHRVFHLSRPDLKPLRNRAPHAERRTSSGQTPPRAVRQRLLMLQSWHIGFLGLLDCRRGASDGTGLQELLQVCLADTYGVAQADGAQLPCLDKAHDRRHI